MRAFKEISVEEGKVRDEHVNENCWFFQVFVFACVQHLLMSSMPQWYKMQYQWIKMQQSFDQKGHMGVLHLQLIFQINCVQIYILMLNQITLDNNAQNRRSEKPPISMQLIYSKINPKSYEMLIEWLMDSATVLRVTRETKYLTRVYLDFVLSSRLNFVENEYIGLSLACLSVAIKFNESVQVRENFTPQYIFQLAQIPYSRQSYYEFETKILFLLNFKLQFTTPYDYIDIFYAKFPWNINFKNALADILDLVLVLPLCASYSSQELFFGTVETIFRQKKLVLTEIQKLVLAGMTDTWGKACQLSVLILAEISQFLG